MKTLTAFERLKRFADLETCPVNEQCVPGFVSGAYWGWGEARNRIGKLLRDNPRLSAIPDAAVCFFKDGSKWCAVHGDFINLQESPHGFGDTFEEALGSLQRDLSPPEPDTCHECGELAVGYSEGTPYCAAHYRSRPSIAELAAQTYGCHGCGEERPARVVAGKLTCPECGSENLTCLD